MNYKIKRLRDGRFFDGVIHGMGCWGQNMEDAKMFDGDSVEVANARKRPDMYELISDKEVKQ